LVLPGILDLVIAEYPYRRAYFVAVDFCCRFGSILSVTNELDHCRFGCAYRFFKEHFLSRE
jgi:hypothetical protein